MPLCPPKIPHGLVLCLTFRGNCPTSDEVCLVSHQDNGLRRHGIGLPQTLKRLLSAPQAGSVHRRVHDAVGVGLVRGNAVLWLWTNVQLLLCVYAFIIL
jgi:hypothetical protein